MYRPAIDRPRVLLVVFHPSVGAGIEAILRVERRYDVRRAAKLTDGVEVARRWPADLVLVDARLLRDAARAAFGVPALILAASAAEAAAAARAVDDSREWVPEDAASADVVSAVERLLTRPAERPAGSLALFGIGALLVVFAGLLLYLIWTAVT